MNSIETYFLTAQVRNKLARDASNPRCPLRKLVLQANLLDELANYANNQGPKYAGDHEVLSPSHSYYSFLSHSPNSYQGYQSHFFDRSMGAHISEVEYFSESDSSDSEESSDDDYYLYSSDEEVEYEDELKPSIDSYTASSDIAIE